MQKHRFYLAPEHCADDVFPLSDRDAHHAANVLRTKPGDEVVILDGEGTELRCRVVNVARRKVEVRVLARRSHPESLYRITLCQGLLKARSMEWVLQKATELGVDRIVPVTTDFAVPAVQEAGHKMRKWSTTMVEAMKQSGNARVPRLSPPCSLQDALAHTRADDLNLVATLAPDAIHPRHRFAEYQALHQRLPQSVSLWIGPEGDFSESEHAVLRAAGATPITLGTYVLRAETAALCGTAMIQYELSFQAEHLA